MLWRPTDARLTALSPEHEHRPSTRQQDRIRTLSRGPAAPGRERRWHRQYLLDIDPELAAALDVRMRLVARFDVAATVLELDQGPLDLARWLTLAAPGPGLLVLQGILVVQARVCERVAAELFGPGDLLQPTDGEEEDAFIDCQLSWHALEPVKLALLDAAFSNRVRAWPQVTNVLLQRAERHAHNLAVQRAIASQPRLEVRLVLLLWHLAARFGKVEPGAVRLPLRLTHQLLGRLVGAERPSVTHALSRLTAAGLLSAEDPGWRLHGTLAEHLSTLGAGGDAHVEQLISSASRRRKR